MDPDLLPPTLIAPGDAPHLVRRDARDTLGLRDKAHGHQLRDDLLDELRDLQTRWRARYRHIRDFEQLLVDEGTTVVKVFLHISREEQRERLQARLDEPTKRWKFDRGDLDIRARWDDFTTAYEEAITETSTGSAPWHVVPADRRWVRDAVVAQLLVSTLRTMDPKVPAADPDLDDVVIT